MKPLTNALPATFANEILGNAFAARLEAAFGTKPAPAVRVGDAGKAALRYIARNPGCCAADVDRACRTARRGHQWMYATVARLRRADLVADAREGARITLRLNARGYRKLWSLA